MDSISYSSLRYHFADFILRNKTNKEEIRTVVELAGEIDGVRDLPDFYDNGTLIKECKKIREEN